MRQAVYWKVIYLFVILTLFPTSIVIANDFGASQSPSNSKTNENASVQFFDEGNLPSEFEGIYSININGDNELINFANNAGWGGDGSDANPYIIENYLITNLGILGVTLRIIIRNNLIGQLTFSGSDCIIENNAVHDSSAIEVTGHNNIIRNNQIDHGGSHTIKLVGDRNLIESNTLVNTKTGLSITGSNNIVERNFVVLEQIENDEIINDIVSSNKHAIKIQGSSNQILGNTFSQAAGYGIVVLQGSEYNTITSNNFINNSGNIQFILDGVSQAYEDNGFSYDQNFEGNNNYNYNFWNDLTNPDEDQNGIIDIPYNIGGVINNDSFPLTNYVNLIPPTIVPPHNKHFGEDEVIQISDLEITETTTLDNVFAGLDPGPYFDPSFDPEKIDENLILPDSFYLLLVIPVVTLLVWLIYKYRKNIRNENI
ncbi:MAG: hypothetical protein GPJ54_03540 [Candidatus Heimdallarchaeota archaeon]|nr:hypothetical protein [Candidatus Heimdallarchaeota archaeon]